MRGSTQTVQSVLLFGTESNLALPVVRILGNTYKDLRIYGLSSEEERYGCARWSKYFTRVETAKLDLEDPLSVLDVTKKIVARYDIDLILPIEEEYVEFIAKHGEELKEYVLIPPVSPVSVFKSLSNKIKLGHTLKDHDLAYVSYEDITNKDISEIQWDEFPCIVKPEESYSGYGVKLLHNRQELTDYLKHKDEMMYIDPEGGFLIQDYIPGHTISISFLSLESEIKLYAIHKGIFNKGFKYPSSMQYIYDSQGLEYLKKVIKRVGYQGLGNVDLCYDERDGAYKLVDLNPRVWSTIHGAYSIGVNFLKAWIDSAYGKEIEFIQYEESYYHMGYGNIAGPKLIKNSSEYSNMIRSYRDMGIRFSDLMPEFFSVWYRLVSGYLG